MMETSLHKGCFCRSNYAHNKLPTQIPHAGNALLTVATGQLTETESERAGLVTTHAYAVLNLIEVKVWFLQPRYSSGQIV